MRSHIAIPLLFRYNTTVVKLAVEKAVQLIDIVELVGVAAFAVSGAATAIKKRMDIFGVIFLAMVTATGGVIRDAVMDGAEEETAASE